MSQLVLKLFPRRWTFVVGFLCGSGFFSLANAQTISSYCEKVLATGDSKASLLFWPTLRVQGIKTPDFGDESGQNLFSSGSFQARASLSISPLNIVKGFSVLNLSHVECKRHLAQIQLEEALSQGIDGGKILGLEKQLSFLILVTPRLKKLVAIQEKRFSEKLLTLNQISELRQQYGYLQRKILVIKRELAFLQVRQPETVSKQPVNQLLVEYREAVRIYETKSSRLRKFDPWKVTLNGGVVPFTGNVDENPDDSSNRVDWFAALELSFNFGGIGQHLAEKRYLAAREKEMTTSKYELKEKTDQLIQSYRQSVPFMEQELALLNEELEDLGSLIEVVQQSKAMEREFALAKLELRKASLRGEKIFLEQVAHHGRSMAAAKYPGEPNIGHAGRSAK